MKENNEEKHLVKQSKNIFIRIRDWFLRRKKKTAEEEVLEPKYNITDFKEDIKIEKDAEEERLLKLQKQFKEGLIEEEEISDEDYEKLLNLYDKQNEEIRKEIEMYRIKTANILKQMKNS